MPILTIDTSATNQMLLRLRAIEASLMPNIIEALADIGAHVEEELSAHAPVGKGEEGPPIGGDAAGRLADSFRMTLSGNEAAAAVQVTTDQPTKLKIIREGRREVRPVQKKALFWQGLDHPVKRSRATQPNDFVTPVLEEAKEYARERLSEAVGETLQFE